MGPANPNAKRGTRFPRRRTRTLVETWEHAPPFPTLSEDTFSQDDCMDLSTAAAASFLPPLGYIKPRAALPTTRRRRRRQRKAVLVVVVGRRFMYIFRPCPPSTFRYTVCTIAQIPICVIFGTRAAYFSNSPPLNHRHPVKTPH